MRRAHDILFLALAVSLLPAAVNCSQAPPANAVSEELRAHVKSERFQIVTSLRGMPLGVRYELGNLFGSFSLDIAEPGEKFEASGVPGDSQLPIRRLVLAGCSQDHCLVYYERGGRSRSWRAALFHWTPDATRFEWGGTAPGNLKTIEAVQSALLSGSVKSSDSPW
jgi:hypothetical protein